MGPPNPPPASADPSPNSRGLRLLDLIGFVAGFGLATLLARTVWPRAADLTGPPLVAFMLEYTWLGLAMSGPIILGLDPRRPSSLPSPRPVRPGRRIAEVDVVSRLASNPSPHELTPRLQFTRAELAWMTIGGYWIALTFLVVPARTTSAPWTLAGLVPIIAVFALLRLIPRRRERDDNQPPPRWTHAVGVGLLWTWPLAWGLLYLLGRTL